MEISPVEVCASNVPPAETDETLTLPVDDEQTNVFADNKVPVMLPVEVSTEILAASE